MQTASHTLFCSQNPFCSLWGVHFDLPILRPLFHIADGPLFVLSIRLLKETCTRPNNIITTQTTKDSFGRCYTATPACRHHLLINNKLHNSYSPSQFINKYASWGTIFVPLSPCPLVPSYNRPLDDTIQCCHGLTEKRQPPFEHFPGSLSRESYAPLFPVSNCTISSHVSSVR